jgi:ABC-type sugar transport system ATPase subunit
MSDALLEIAGLAKAFPGVQALENVSLSVRRGEIHALVGENGAGKSTLMKILAGIHSKDAGRILLDGQPVAPATPAEALRLGLSSVHQEISLAPNLTVAENVFVGHEPTRVGFVDWTRLGRETNKLLASLGVRLDPRARVGSLNLAMRQVVEIARGLSHEPKVLMLDEPTSSLEEHEVAHLLQTLRRLAASGMAILYVTHKLKELFEIANTVTVLRDGKWVATKPIAQTSPDEVVRLMVGRELTGLYPPKATAAGSELLRVRGLTLRGRFSDISFALRRGEILGLAGLVGAGRSEVAQALFGRFPAESGSIELEGRPVTVRSPAEAVRHGIAYLPEDRKGSGLFPAMSVKDNLFAAGLERYAHWGLVSARSLNESATAWMRRLEIRTPSVQQRIGLLSGGNQQKALLARWLDLKPRLLIADEPTRGIDIGAKAEIHRLLRRLCEEGIGVIVISSELPEVLGLCDRIVVLHEGRVAGELKAEKATEEAVMRLATGQVVDQLAA